MTGLRGRDTTLKATKRKRLLHRFALDTARAVDSPHASCTGVSPTLHTLSILPFNMYLWPDHGCLSTFILYVYM